jgi:hypothetical protein
MVANECKQYIKEGNSKIHEFVKHFNEQVVKANAQ